MSINRFDDGFEAEGFEVEALDPELAGLLGASLTPVEPSEGFKEALFAELDGAGGTLSDEEADSAPLAPVVPLRRTMRSWLVRAAAAAAVFVVGIGIGRGAAMNDMSEAHSYAMLNQSQDVERSSDTMPDGHVATLTWSPDMGKAAVTLPAAMSEGMTGPGSQKVLQVWVRDAQDTRSAGVYAPSRGMDFAFIDLMPEDGDEIFVTIEPAGGSASPSGEPLVAMRVGPEDAPASGQGSGVSGRTTANDPVKNV